MINTSNTTVNNNKNFQQQDSELLFDEIHLRDYLNVVFRHIYLVIAAFLIVLTTAVIVTFSATPIYQATCKAMIEEDAGEQYDISTDPGGSYFRNRQFFETQVEVLKSKPVLEEVASQLKLYDKPEKTPGLLSSIKSAVLGLIKGSAPKSDNEALAEYSKRQNTLKGLSNSLSFNVVRDTSIVQISCEDSNPILARDIADTVAQVFAKYSLDLKIKEITNASVYLSARLTDIKEQLVLSEGELKNFQEEKEAISLDRRIENLTEQRINAGNELNTIERTIAQKTSYFDTLADQTKDVRAKFAAGDVGSFSNLKNKQQELRTQLAQLLRDFTTNHPTVQTVKRDLAALDAQIEEQRKLLIAGESSTMQGIENTLEQYKEAMREVEGLKAQRTALGHILERTQESLKALLRLKSQYSLLQREVESNQKLFEMILIKTKEVSLKEAMQISDVKIIEQASLPLIPVKPRKSLNLILGCMVGLFLGIGLAFLADYFDATLKTKAEIHDLVKMPVLGMFPQVNEETKGDKLEKVVFNKASSPYSESFRSLGTSIKYTGEEPPKTILVTSACSGEGKTTVASNLAIVFAQTGDRVVLVDCDLRKPRHHRLYDIDRTPGLTDVNDGDFMSLIQESGIENLSIISCGTKIGNPAKFIHQSIAKLVANLSDNFDRIIFDSPPVSAVTDSAIISRHVNSVLLVVSAGKATKNDVTGALEELRQVGAPLIGTVVNNLREEAGGYYYYNRYSKGYYRAYGEE
jgi:capsular exopolysaccharide synthesis family protein